METGLTTTNPSAEAGEIVQMLNSKDAAKQAQAEDRLREMGPAAVEALLDLMAAEARRRRRRRRIGYAVAGAYLTILVVVLAAYAYRGTATGTWSHFPTGLFQVANYTGLFAAMFAATRQQKKAASKLAQYDDIRATGRLAESLEYGDADLRKESAAALARLLPQLRASDGDLLPAESRAALNRVLISKTVGYEGPLIIGTLAAWEQIGDESCVEPVRKVAEGTAPASSMAGVADAARQCLPALTERVERERASQTLLRASYASDDPGHSLLRPASIGEAADPSTLVRPVDDQVAP